MKKLLVAALLASSAFHIAPAVANHECVEPTDYPACALDHGDCSFDTIAQEDATGGQDTFTGAAFGYIVSSTPGTAVTIRCYVRVDGGEVTGASTPTGSGSTVATTSGQVTYTATEGQDVDLCAEWKIGTGAPQTLCFETTTTQIPPQVVIDTINDLLTLVFDTLDPVFQIIADNTHEVDVIVCTALKAGGVPAVINATTSIHGFSMDNDAVNGNDCDIWDETTDPRTRVLDFWVYED